uniref:Single-pass membrane protein with coiled-coil domains 2 n=1 Tax=Catagonus wagneri TaxID=51154 RepID=A0A8C3WZH0_9CETA
MYIYRQIPGSLSMQGGPPSQIYHDSLKSICNSISLNRVTYSLLREFTQMDRIMDRSDDEDIFSENPQTNFLHDLETEKWAEHDQDLQSELNKQEKDHVPHEDPQASTSLKFSEKNIPQLQENVFFQLNYWNIQMSLQVKELGADHIGWMENIKNIIQKINLTENTVNSLLSEVMSLEGQIEKLESHQDLDPDEGVNIEVSWRLGKGNLGCGDSNFCKVMALLNTMLRIYQRQGGKTDSQSPEEMGMEEREPLLPQAPTPSLVQNSPPRITMWKRALRIFIMLYVVIFTGLSCYILVFDATFIFERILRTILGRRRMWELREMIAPFLNLEVEDLLPS